MFWGAPYGTFFEEELPALARSFFPLSDRREDNFIAGLSMGGYGAMRLALKHPERYAAAASLSGCLDLRTFETTEVAERSFWIKRAFGDAYSEITGSSADLLAQLDLAKQSGVKLPELFACCGRDDHTLEDNRVFTAKCAELGIPLEYIENEGAHEWGYWDRMIQEVLNWLPRRA